MLGLPDKPGHENCLLVDYSVLARLVRNALLDRSACRLSSVAVHWISAHGWGGGVPTFNVVSGGSRCPRVAAMVERACAIPAQGRRLSVGPEWRGQRAIPLPLSLPDWVRIHSTIRIAGKVWLLLGRDVAGRQPGKPTRVVQSETLS